MSETYNLGTLSCRRTPGGSRTVEAKLSFAITYPQLVDFYKLEELNRQSHGRIYAALASAGASDEDMVLSGHHVAELIELCERWSRGFPGDLFDSETNGITQCLLGNGPSANELDLLSTMVPDLLIGTRVTIRFAPSGPSYQFYGELGSRSGVYAAVTFTPAGSGTALPINLKVERWQDMSEADAHCEGCPSHYLNEDGTNEEEAIEAAASYIGVSSDLVSLECDCEPQVALTRCCILPKDWDYKDEETQRIVLQWVEKSLWADRDIHESDIEEISYE